MVHENARIFRAIPEDGSHHPRPIGCFGLAAQIPARRRLQFADVRLRRSILTLSFSTAPIPAIRKMGYQAVRTSRWKYIHYRDISGADELYDLVKDPYEMKNVINDPQAPRTEMQERLAKLRDS